MGTDGGPGAKGPVVCTRFKHSIYFYDTNALRSHVT